jgi:hypothetical protein
MTLKDTLSTKDERACGWQWTCVVDSDVTLGDQVSLVTSRVYEAAVDPEIDRRLAS